VASESLQRAGLPLPERSRGGGHSNGVGSPRLYAALSVAAATVYGRYYYVADAVAGVLVGVMAFVVTRRIHKA
jgi:hypothetical protein